MKTFQIIIFSILAFTFSAWGQSRDCKLDINVTTSTGTAVGGTVFNLKHLGYSISYSASETKLDENGHCSINVYAGQHAITIEAAGFATYTETFDVTGNKNLNITLSEETIKPYSLTATIAHNAYTSTNDAILTWNTEAPAFFDDFESYPDFAINFGNWTGIDGDKIAAAPLAGSYQNRGALQYAQIINPLTVDPTWWYEYEVLRPYSGKQYVGFVRTTTGEANNDWLISPAITVGNNNVLNFKAKAADIYKERFQVGITTAENPTEADFTIISAGNYETASYETWLDRTFDLSAYAGKTVKIGIHYISEANRGGAFMLMVDDFFVGQKTAIKKSAARRSSSYLSPANPNESFHIYLNDNKVAETNIYSYTFKELPEGTHKLGVKAVYTASETEISSIDITVSNANCHKLDFTVTTNNGLSPDGISINLICKETSQQYSVAVADGKASMPSLPAGSYVVNVTTDTYDPFETEIKLSADNTLPINLVETIVTPYNLTADVTPNADNAQNIDLTLKWNQDLGFSDSFESYADFATAFGEWTALDLDKMPVYPIGLGSTSNIVTFPGSGTATSPTPIAPMVFNPLKTIPSMETDPAILAPTGNKTVIFFSPQRAKADKWIISPEQTIREGYIWKLTAKGYSSGYPETIEICISTTTNEPSAFTVIDTVTLPSDYWETYSIDLEDYANEKVYLGIHYISTDAFIAQVDDFYVGPSDSQAEGFAGNVLRYEVAMDSNAANQTNTTSYTFSDITDAHHIFTVKAIYQSGASEMATYTYDNAGIKRVEASGVKVIGSTNAIQILTEAPTTATIYDISGRKIIETNIDDRATIPVSKGLYIVNVNNYTFKVIAK